MIFEKHWKNFIKKHYEFYFPKKEIKIPQIKDSIGIIQVKEILRKHCKSQNIYLSDPTYLITSMHEAKRFTKESLIETKKYQLHTHDCENFSFALNGYWSDSLKSFCFGIAWSKTHAFNIMIDYKKQIWICEPQTNKWTKIESFKNNKMYYPLRLIII